MLGFRLLKWVLVVLVVLGFSPSAEASTKSLLAGLAPSRIESARNPDVLTDGVQVGGGVVRAYWIGHRDSVLQYIERRSMRV